MLEIKMDLLNTNLNNFYTTISDFDVSFNGDIFETNVINISILASGLFYLLINALSLALIERQQKILATITESKEKLNESIDRRLEGEKRLRQAQLIIDSINLEAKTTGENLKAAILKEGKEDIERLTASTKNQIMTIEAKVRKQISDYVITLALKRVTLQLEGKLTPNLQQQIIDRNISKLTD